jgi:putative transcriptional regulator
MKAELFAELLESVQELDAVLVAARTASRVVVMDEAEVKQVRAMTGLSQARLARLLRVDVATLRNWEQGRRRPTGPARALLTAVARDPEHVLKALASPPRYPAKLTNTVFLCVKCSSIASRLASLPSPDCFTPP